jgi:hypothetical protein
VLDLPASQSIRVRPELVRVAVRLYADAYTALECRGETLVRYGPGTMRPNDDAVRFLRDARCAAIAGNCFGVRHAVVEENELADLVLKLGGGCASTPSTRARELPPTLRDDLRDAAEEIVSLARPAQRTCRRLCIVNGPPETGAALCAALTRVFAAQPAVMVCGTFHTAWHAAASAPYRVPNAVAIAGQLNQLSTAVRACATAASGSGRGIVVLVGCEAAGSRLLTAVLRLILSEPAIVVVLVGDVETVLAPPEEPDFGRPFRAIAAASTRLAVFRVGHQVTPTVVESDIEQFLAHPSAATITTLSAVQFVDEQTTVVLRAADVVLCSDAQTCRAVQTVLTTAPTTSFRKGDLVTVTTDGGRMVAAGRLVGLRTGFAEIPLDAQPGTSVEFPLRSTPAAASITVQLDTCSDVHANDRFPLRHLHVANLRRVPWFRVATAVFVLSSAPMKSTADDLIRASRIATDQLVIVHPQVTEVVALAQRRLTERSALAYVLAHAQ